MLLRYIFRRIAIMIPTLIVTSMLIFTVIDLPPGDYFETYIAELQAQGENVNIEQIECAAQGIRFRQAALRRYFKWIGGMFAKGDFGYSFEYQLPVSRRRRRSHLWLTMLVSFVHHHFHLARRLSDRHLFGDAPI